MQACKRGGRAVERIEKIILYGPVGMILVAPCLIFRFPHLFPSVHVGCNYKLIAMRHPVCRFPTNASSLLPHFSDTSLVFLYGCLCCPNFYTCISSALDVHHCTAFLQLLGVDRPYAQTRPRYNCLETVPFAMGKIFFLARDALCHGSITFTLIHVV